MGDEAPPSPGAVVRIAGTAECWQETLTLKLAACVTDPAIDTEAFRPRVPEARRAKLADLDALVEQIADPALRAWVERCFPVAVRDRFATHPAAVRHHGAMVGGLLKVKSWKFCKSPPSASPSVSRPRRATGAGATGRRRSSQNGSMSR